VTELTAVVGTTGACAAVGRTRARHYRWLKPPAPMPKREPAPQPRALSVAERTQVLDVLHSERFVDLAPPSVYATLLDEGSYLASIPTMYRILRSVDEVGERRRVAKHPPYVKPELVAWRPNMIWSWDIIKLLGPAKWTYYYLYVILDIFSRYVVGWMVASCERADLAERLLAESICKQRVDRDQLTIHADRGSSMASKPVAFLLADLGVTKTHSRPHCPNDNPFSEAQFKTLKYMPSSRTDSGRRSTRAASASGSSLGTPTSTVIPVSATTPRLTSTTAAPRSCALSASMCWPPPTQPTLSASSARRRSPRSSPARRGSTALPRTWCPRPNDSDRRLSQRG
jgi:transposase InsO family protein